MILAAFHTNHLLKRFDAAGLIGPAASGIDAKGRGEGGLGADPLFG